MPLKRGWLREARRERHMTAWHTRCSLAEAAGRAAPDSCPDIILAGDSEEWPVNALGARPQAGDFRLAEPGLLKPLVAGESGVLLGGLQIPGGKMVWMLSDPEPLMNGSILKGENLRFALRLAEAFLDGDKGAPLSFFDPGGAGGAFSARRDPRGARGLELSPKNILFLLLTVLAALLFAVFGLRRAWPEEPPGEGVRYGSLGLVKNSARLVSSAGHREELCLKYLRLALGSIAQSARAPKGAAGSTEELLGFLDKCFERRGAALKPPSAAYREAAAAARSPSPEGMIKGALALYQYKEELDRGSGAYSKNIIRRAR
jgi:hypothetical protein